MIIKTANFSLQNPVPLTNVTGTGMIKTAATKIGLDSNPDVKNIVESEIKKHPTALFFRAKAIVADEPNSNGDMFPKTELRKSYQTFVGVPFYTNHNNQDIEQARGKIIYAEWNEGEGTVYVIGFVDREAYPHICRGIEQDYMTGVSMGTSVEYSECSICRNKAATTEEYCNHVKHLKGRTFTGTAKDVKTGEIKNFKKAPVYEVNYGMRFIELSGVGDPACKTCHIEGVFDNKEVLLHKAASCENNFYMVKESSLYKSASQEEVQQLEQALASLEQISISLIKNRKQVEVEFASDLVKILSDLQQFTDELVGAGYGQVAGGTPEVPGVVGNEPVPMPPAEQPASAPMAQPGMAPIAEELPPEPVGRTTGAPGTPFVKAPRMPTPPVKPMASMVERFEKLSATLRQVLGRMDNTDEGDEMKRRIPPVASSERNEVKRSLETSMSEKESAGFSGNSNHYRDNENKNGGSVMSEIQKTAARTEAPDQLTEKQLETGIKYHPRENDSKDQITQKQLDAKRTGDEPQVLTEKQIEAKRTDATPEVVTQKQLDAVRKDSEPEVITQKQLAEGGYKTDKEPEVVTEKQLDGQPASVWTRKAFARKDIKTAKEHLEAVIRSLASAIIDSSATPEQVKAVVGGMVDGVKAKASTLDEITRDVKADAKPALDVASRAKYWGSKGVTIASATNDDVKSTVVSKLASLVSSDEKIHPEMVMDVLEVVAEEDASVKEISASVDAMLISKPSEVTKASKKSEIKEALRKSVEKPAEAPAKAEQRKEERVAAKASVKKPTHVIEATLAEVGIKDLSDKGIKAKIASFVKGAVAASNMKLAAVTNVSIDGDVIQIAISTDEGPAVEVPLAGEEVGPETAPVEGDTTGEGLDALAVPPPPAAGAPAGVPPVPPPPMAPLPMASAKDGLKKEAQFGGGTGGGIPGAELGGMAQPMPPAAAPAGAPAMDVGLQSLTGEPKDEKEEAPGVGEQMMPGAICPVCHSTDTTVGKEGRGDGVYECNSCGLVYSVSVVMEVLNPDKMEVSEEKKEEGKVKEPELPSMPVAAEVKLDKNSLHKVAAASKKYGNVCPACGMVDCKASEQEAGKTVFVCPSCETTSTKELLVNKDNPEESVLRIAWVLDPKKVGSAKCKGCKEAARKFAASVKVTRMLKSARNMAGDPETAFPMANCVERISRRYGSNAVATFGPCKGKALPECVCKQLETFGMRKVRHLEKLASVYSQQDPMDECVKDHVGKGYKDAQASVICECMKKKYATEADENEFIMAFADSGEYTLEELRVMKQKHEELNKKAQVEPDADMDIGAPIDAVPPHVEEEETVTIELPEDVAKDIQAQLGMAIQAEEAGDQVAEVVPGEPKLDSATAVEVAASAKKAVKTAEQPKKVEHIEGNVEAGVPRAKATLGKEGPDNIDVPMNKPKIPTAGEGARMGSESAENIDKKATLPDIPVDDSKMGGEKETQKGMPAVNNEIKGTVIAKTENMTKEAEKPKKVENIEGNVDAGVPRAKATLGKEGPDNIDVAAKKPEIPSVGEKARLGNESAENIDPKADLPDIPVDDAKMGGEKETQKGMPAINNEIKGTVIAEMKEKQLLRVAAERHRKACQVASKLLGQRRIAEQDFDEVVEDLSKLELKRIESFAERMFKAPVTASAQAPAVLASPIVQEASAYSPEQPKSAKDQLAADLADCFTTGSKELDRIIKEEDAKNK